jgi:pimeloyl-ACP methyl ester carboxylesterase
MSWHYQQQGTGRPLILLHGIGMSHSAWRPVMPLLAKHRQVIAFDLPGFGRSAVLADGTIPNAHNIIKSY